jgi:tyrosinase
MVRNTQKGSDSLNIERIKSIKLIANRRSLSVSQRTDYIKAVQCMMSKPPISKKFFPVVTNRYEDFVALHANATAGGAKLDGPATGFPRMNRGGNNGIHNVGVFLPWHRYGELRRLDEN